MSNPGTHGLVSWWRLEESSGARADAHGGQTLTDNNTVASASGKQGQAADLEASNSEYLSRADSAALSLGDVDATLGLWARLESKGTLRALLSKFEPSGDQREYRILYENTTDRFYWNVSSDGTSGGETMLAANALGSPATATWYFIVVWHDAAANEIGIQVNNGAGDTAAHSGGVHDGTAALRLGAIGGPAQYMDGLLDEAFLYKRLLSADERAWLYNGGAGRAYAEVDIPMPQSAVLTMAGLTPAIATYDTRLRLHARPRRTALHALPRRDG